MIQHYVDQLAEAFSRIEYTVQELHRGQDDWTFNPDNAMYSFNGFVHPMVVKKHVVDLVREVWHVYDGTRELVNAKWKVGQINATKTDLDNGRGPGKAIVNTHVAKCRWIQLCGDLANLTKHYKLTRATKTGSGPPAIGDSMFKSTMSGKLDIERKPDGTRIIKAEKPFTMRPTLVVLGEDGTQIGDAVDIALKARDSWLELLGRCGCTFSKAAG